MTARSAPIRSCAPAWQRDAARTFEALVSKPRSFNAAQAQALNADRNYHDLDQMVPEHLMGVK